MNTDKKCEGCLFSGSTVEGKWGNIGILITRVSVGLMMAFSHGLGKVPPNDYLIGGVERMGFPMPSLFAWCAGLSEFIGAILVALGLMTRLSSATVAFTMFIAAFVAHANDPFSKKEFALLYMLIFVLFAFMGGGKFSLDSLIKSRKS